MKTLTRTTAQLAAAKRWDIDYHLPAEMIKSFDSSIVRRLDAVATTVRDTRDPGADPDTAFKYVDIASVDVGSASITSPQTLLGSEAPSRARKVVQAFDIVVSTVRPTRGAVAVVPEELHDEIASTGFAIVRANPDINPFYLHFALRLPSTKEQFRKWSTGSSYPAILDSDVAKTLIPVPDRATQDRFAISLLQATRKRDAAVQEANAKWRENECAIISELSANPAQEEPIAFTEGTSPHHWNGEPSIDEIQRVLNLLRAGESPDLPIMDEGLLAG